MTIKLDTMARQVRVRESRIVLKILLSSEGGIKETLWWLSTSNRTKPLTITLQHHLCVWLRLDRTSFRSVTLYITESVHHSTDQCALLLYKIRFRFNAHICLKFFNHNLWCHEWRVCQIYFMWDTPIGRDAMDRKGFGSVQQGGQTCVFKNDIVFVTRLNTVFIFTFGHKRKAMLERTRMENSSQETFLKALIKSIYGTRKHKW